MGSSRHRVYLGLGSNVGDRRRNIERALAALAALPRTRRLALSSFYETSPVGPAQKDYVNAVAKYATGLPPRELLAAVKAIEREMGRRPGRKWGPRIIDIDILFYGRRVLRTETLRLPHPELHRRLFVLEPLAEIAPRLVHPILKATARKLREKRRLTSPEQKVRILQ